MTEDPDISPFLPPHRRTRIQRIIGTLLYYGRAVDSTILPCLGSLGSAQATPTEKTDAIVNHLLAYLHSHPNATIRYHASGMILHIHSDASYLSEANARSRAGGYFYLSELYANPNKAPSHDSPLPPMNGAIHVLSTILKNVMASASEAELGALFLNAREAATIRTTLVELGHPQPPTPIITDNKCAAGIANDTVKQKRSKAIDMRFFWIVDRIKQNMSLVHWRRGIENLADYFTKHHSPAHHRLVRSWYLHCLHSARQNNQGVTRVC